MRQIVDKNNIMERWFLFRGEIQGLLGDGNVSFWGEYSDDKTSFLKEEIVVRRAENSDYETNNLKEEIVHGRQRFDTFPMMIPRIWKKV